MRAWVEPVVDPAGQHERVAGRETTRPERVASVAAMDGSLVRPARVEDAAAMARVHVLCWRETYRGLMSEEVLGDPDLLPARERFWVAALSDERYARNRVAVAEHDNQVVGITMSGPAGDDDAFWPVQLYVLYVVAAHHGSGVGAALLDAVINPGEASALWVADPNERAQAFYRKHGFVPDGKDRVDNGVRSIRMVRTARQDLGG